MTKWREMTEEQQMRKVAQMICGHIDGEFHSQSAHSQHSYKHLARELLDELKRLGAFDGWPESRLANERPGDSDQEVLLEDTNGDFCIARCDEFWFDIQEYMMIKNPKQWWPLPERKEP